MFIDCIRYAWTLHNDKAGNLETCIIDICIHFL
jgi:hypothetical protein